MEFQRFVQRLVRRQRLLLARLSRAEELADAMALEIEEFERGLNPRGSTGSAARARPPRGRERLTASMNVRATEIAIRRRPDDWGLVRVDQADEFLLPPILTDLFAILVAECGPSDDELVAWQTLGEVAKRMEKKAGRTFSRHAVTQHVHRLRRELFNRGGMSPMLVQTSRRFGVRVAVRRRRPGTGE